MTLRKMPRRNLNHRQSATETNGLARKVEAGEVRRRDFLNIAPLAVAGTGAAFALWPLIDSMNPSADLLAQSKIEVDLAPIEPGQRVTVGWKNQPVFIVRRTPDLIALAEAEDQSPGLIDPETDAERILQPEW